MSHVMHEALAPSLALAFVLSLSLVTNFFVAFHQ